MSVPKFDSLLQTLENTLRDFNPTLMAYLDIEGSWSRYPQTLRDRISNELWYRIWEVQKNKDHIEQIKSIIQPFICEENAWNTTVSIFEGISNRKGESRGLLVIFEVLCSLVEYSACKRNSMIRVADWNQQGKVERCQYLVKVREFIKKAQEILTDEARMNVLSRIFNRLEGKRNKTYDEAKLPQGIFNTVSSIIAEEEKVRKWVTDFLIESRNSKEKYGNYPIIDEYMDLEIKRVTNIPQALVRPCLEILNNSNIDISSGLQYKSSSTLGALNDIRSTGSLLKALERTDIKYTNVRCNLIYALGNLKQKKALKNFIDVLEEPDYVEVHVSNGTQKYNQTLLWEKCEAVWALGKLEVEATQAIPTLIEYVSSLDKEMNISLAWTMGMIGMGQKEKYNGIDSDIVITLMNLLKVKDSNVFEEVALSLRKLGLPDFLHSLYLHDINTVPILALKPSSIGLYELSETIFHLMSVRKPVVMAVTGDSGTGKTYFCEAIKTGFSTIAEDEILYLGRDNPAHLRLFNRLLGIIFLRAHVDPQYYRNYPVTAEKDNPDEFFDNFIREYSHKKLIILDGWMDREYFLQVVRTFYRRSYLDVVVNFRATFSTKRHNLEERENLLENVKKCLSYIEGPVIEETEFYRDCGALIYNLDNSSASRLDKEEIREIFQRRKVDTWGDYIRIGNFIKNSLPLQIYNEKLVSCEENIRLKTENLSLKEVSSFFPTEMSFSRVLNENIEEEPNLLETIKFHGFDIHRIAIYTQGQLACGGYDGSVGILSGINDRIFRVSSHKCEVARLTIVGGDICSIDVQGKLKITSFKRNKIIDLGTCRSPVCSITSDRTGLVITGHIDGSLRIWDIQSQELTIIRGHRGPVLALAMGQNRRIFSGGQDEELRIWDITSKKLQVFKGHKAPIPVVSVYPDGRAVTGTAGRFENGDRISDVNIRMIDCNTGKSKIIHLRNIRAIDRVHVYFDGRLIVGMKGTVTHDSRCNLAIIDPRPDFQRYKMIGGHRLQTRDCVTMGPRIITCGSESNSEHTLRIWGTEFYVRVERDKLKLLTEAMAKPSYYRMLF